MTKAQYFGNINTRLACTHTNCPNHFRILLCFGDRL